jgi:hypothetical protein
MGGRGNMLARYWVVKGRAEGESCDGWVLGGWGLDIVGGYGGDAAAAFIFVFRAYCFAHF